MGIVTVEAIGGMDLGKGFDKLSWDPKVLRAVEGKVVTAKDATGQKGKYKFMEVTSTRELQESLGITAEVNANAGLVKVGVKAEFCKQVKSNSEAVTILIAWVARNATRFFDNPKLTPAAEELFRLRDKERIRERYGNKFSYARDDGGFFYAVFKSEGLVSTEEEEFKAAVHAAYGFVKGEAKFEKSHRETISKSSTEIIMISEGGKNIGSTRTIDDLFDNLDKIASQVAKGHGVPIEYTLEEYGELELPFDNISSAEEQLATDTIRNLGEHYVAMQDWENKIDCVLRNQQLYKIKKNTVSDLNEAAKKVAFELNKIAKKADTCIRDFAKCEPYSPEYPDQRIIPDRKGKSSGGGSVTIDLDKINQLKLKELKKSNIEKQINQLNIMVANLPRNSKQRKRLKKRIRELNRA